MMIDDIIHHIFILYQKLLPNFNTFFCTEGPEHLLIL